MYSRRRHTISFKEHSEMKKKNANHNKCHIDMLLNIICGIDMFFKVNMPLSSPFSTMPPTFPPCLYGQLSPIIFVTFETQFLIFHSKGVLLLLLIRAKPLSGHPRVDYSSLITCVTVFIPCCMSSVSIFTVQA